MEYITEWKENGGNIPLIGVMIRLFIGAKDEIEDAEILHVDGQEERKISWEEQWKGMKLSVVLPDRYKHFLQVCKKALARKEISVYSWVDETTQKCYDIWITKTDQQDCLKVFLLDNIREQIIRKLLHMSRQHLRRIQQELVKFKKEKDSIQALKLTFLTHIKHEIRTPMNAIIGFSNLLKEAEKEEERKFYTHLIEENNEELLDLMNDMLDLAKLDAGMIEFSVEQANLNVLLYEIREGFKIRNPKIWERMILDKSFVSLVVNTDISRLRQILNYLVRHVGRYSSQKYIHLGYWEEDSWILCYISNKEYNPLQGLKTSLRNNGMRLDSFSQGGARLILCQRLIECLGGNLLMNSSADGGGDCSFVVLLKKEEEKN